MKLRNKIFAINAVIIFVVFTVIGAVAVESVYGYNLESIYKQLLNNSNFSGRHITQYLELQASDDFRPVFEENISAFANQLSRQVGHPVRVISADETELRPEQAEALKGNKAYFINTKGEQKVFFFAFPVIYEDQILGAVSYEYPLNELNKMRQVLILIFSALFILAIILVFILSYLFSYRMFSPLEKLQYAASEFGRGNFSSKVIDIKTGDEIESLALSFNQMGQDIQRMIRDLEEEQAKQKRFYDSVTHEIRTPLTNIIGYADLVTRLKDESEKEKSIGYIQQEGGTLLRMVENLLELSKLKQYDLTLVKKEDNIKEIIENVVEVMALRLEKFGFTARCDLAEVRAEVDSERLRQVFINLIDNAVKHSEGDKLKLRLWRDHLIFIEVSDNGKGLPVDELRNIAEPFYRVEKSRSRKLGGAGLGLSICQEIISKHGGTLSIQSEPGSGTTVTICLQP